MEKCTVYYKPVTRFHMGQQKFQPNLVGRHNTWCGSVPRFTTLVPQILFELITKFITQNHSLLLLNDDSQIVLTGRQWELLLGGLTAVIKLHVQEVDAASQPEDQEIADKFPCHCIYLSCLLSTLKRQNPPLSRCGHTQRCNKEEASGVMNRGPLCHTMAGWLLEVFNPIKFI